MPKKAITQVMEWLTDAKGHATGEDTVRVTAAKCEWAIRALKRLDARDSQVQVRYRKHPRKRAAKRVVGQR